MVYRLAQRCASCNAELTRLSLYLQDRQCPVGQEASALFADRQATGQTTVPVGNRSRAGDVLSRTLLCMVLSNYCAQEEQVCSLHH